MLLSKWRISQGLTQKEVALKLGCHLVTICRYETDVRTPTDTMQRKIFALTNGAVTPNDWLLPQTIVEDIAGRAASE